MFSIRLLSTIQFYPNIIGCVLTQCLDHLYLIFAEAWQSVDHTIVIGSLEVVGYEPADLTVHPPRTAEGGFIFFV